MKKLNNKGFTLIELMIASVVFATLLLFSTAIIIQIGRLYQKGLTTTRTQESVRRITDEISGAIQFSGDTIRTSGVAPIKVGANTGFEADAYAICTGSVRYSYAIGAQVSDAADAGKYDRLATSKNLIKHGLWREKITSTDSCTPSDITKTAPTGSGGTDGTELLAKGTRLADLQVKPLDDKGKLWSIRVLVLRGENDLLDATKSKCTTGIAGKEFCASAELNLNVVRRLD